MTNLITRKGNKLQLTGNVLTGDTFAVKGYIKQYIDGKWNKNIKGWTIDLDKLSEVLEHNSIGLRIDYDAITTPEPMTYEHFLRSADDPNSDY